MAETAALRDRDPKSKLRAQTEKRPSKVSDSDTGFEVVDTIDTAPKRPSEDPVSDKHLEDLKVSHTIHMARKRHQREDLRLGSSESSARHPLTPLRSHQPYQTSPQQAPSKNPQQILSLLVARAVNGAHIFRLQMGHLFGKDDPTAEDIILAPITEQVKASGFPAPERMMYVHVRMNGENDPVFSDATLKTAFRDYLIHESRPAPFTLFIEDRDGNHWDLPALKRHQDVDMGNGSLDANRS
ncbi:hypothetical protein LTR10_012682 [Elasticomyces elasticus]|uniref:Tautomerase cis-CaaD-like domain-containing protein n=1 Tax=Exophiala sideris TaxID=1016849 RepID=A0ABR0JRB1_9EURO|nr:hypothetical protein LTR10_012682 [Elasticomyces elasticus]KAK5034560.1 hypothetical protein LTR13_006215 [Exophiala sideris]KAK5040118.1 hypothetical protein LTS07_000615 [Exophiala sideris]KAK5068496.1 hypothetical protein LTR69_000616 [Exophiala sideris]KAK5187799.1 hypothetical protein LTR44_000617 [Eurotiomycetes sp. CCFEE 6388]